MVVGLDQIDLAVGGKLGNAVFHDGGTSLIQLDDIGHVDAGVKRALSLHDAMIGGEQLMRRANCSDGIFAGNDLISLARIFATLKSAFVENCGSSS